MAPWTDAFLLKNPVLEVVVVPSMGRIMQIRPHQGPNLLRTDPNHVAVHEQSGDTWENLGGDLLWPVAQNHWQDLLGSHWPPPPHLDEQDWEATAWEEVDGRQSCLLLKEYGDPLQINLSRLVQLDATAPRITIHQRIERTGDSDIPVTLWNVSQLHAANRAFMPVDEDSEFENGYRKLIRDDSVEEFLKNDVGMLILDAGAPGEQKLGSDSKQSWVAAQVGNIMVVERTENQTPEGRYPEDGCRVEVYSNTHADYMEIETLSPEKKLAAGETLENVLSIDCLALGTDTDVDETARRVRQFVRDCNA